MLYPELEDYEYNWFVGILIWITTAYVAWRDVKSCRNRDREKLGEAD
jgi:hypothetical protein